MSELLGHEITWDQDDTGNVHFVPPPSIPMAVARDLVKALYTSVGRLLLRDHRGDFYRWNGVCWPTIDKRDVRKAAYQ